MIVRLSVRGATLEHADDFQRFEIVTSLPDSGIDASLAPIGRREGNHAWISGKWLETAGHPDDPVWREHYADMIAYANRKGWVDDQGFIRGHFAERPDASHEG